MPSLTVFTPSFADKDNTNAQNLTVKEIVARLPAEEFYVTMLASTAPDARIAGRENTRLVRYGRRGNTARILPAILFPPPDVYFYPRYGLLDQMFVALRRRLRLRTALVSHMVMMMTEKTAIPFVRRLVRESDGVFGNSRYVAETIQQYCGVAAETIHNGIDFRFFYPGAGGEGRASGGAVVLYAGTFQERKRVTLLVQQAARRPDVEFRLAGQGETETECRRLVTELGCRNVVFLGHLSPAALGEEMRRAQVFAFPSILEGHPQVLGQAAACGLTVVAMNVYRPDYVAQGKSGFLVESDADFVQKLDILLDNSELRRTFSAAAVEHAQQFSWDRIAGRWAEVLRQAVERRRAS
jgi:glycosyltransferase involved in cell wall biosynthesis